jgi:probable rRNA maturation factor
MEKVPLARYNFFCTKEFRARHQHLCQKTIIFKFEFEGLKNFTMVLEKGQCFLTDGKCNRSMKIGPVLLIRDTGSGPLPKALIERAARGIYAKEGIPEARKTHVIFCSDNTIARLNSKFRGEKHPTDVLSFTYDDEDLLGEIYISLQRVRVQALRYGVSRSNEIVRLFVHGMHHLLGFDHEEPGDRKKMESAESRYL